MQFVAWKHSMQCVAGPCKYEMHDEQLGWEEIQAEYDALSEREKQRYGRTARQVRLDPCCLLLGCGGVRC
jgi:hypothetical protein